MKLHRNLVFAVIDALNLIFNENEYADKVVQKVLRFDKRWGARDRGFIAETTYEMVRYKRLYAEIAEVKAPFSRPDLFRMWAVWAVLKGINIPDWKQIEPTPERRIKGKFDELSQIRKFREAIPDWIDELGEKALGDKLWTEEIAKLNEPAEVILRTNTLRTTKEELRKALLDENIVAEPIRGYASALKLVGQRVVDTCAGAGGKSLHLAALMENKGQLISMDIYGSKLKELKRRARRNGAHNIEVREIDSSKVYKKLYGSADRVLIDAPCTGLGVLRRNPDSKWKMQPEFLDKIVKTQQEILIQQ